VRALILFWACASCSAAVAGFALAIVNTKMALCLIADISCLVLTISTSSRILSVQTVASPIFAVLHASASMKANMLACSTDVDFVFTEKTREPVWANAVLKFMAIHCFINQVLDSFEPPQKSMAFNSFSTFSTIQAFKFAFRFTWERRSTLREFAVWTSEPCGTIAIVDSISIVVTSSRVCAEGVSIHGCSLRTKRRRMGFTAAPCKTVCPVMG